MDSDPTSESSFRFRCFLCSAHGRPWLCPQSQALTRPSPAVTSTVSVSLYISLFLSGTQISKTFKRLVQQFIFICGQSPLTCKHPVNHCSCCCSDIHGLGKLATLPLQLVLIRVLLEPVSSFKTSRKPSR